MSRFIRLMLCFIVAAVPYAGANDTADGIRDFGKAVFSEVERRVIRDYYHEKYGAMDGDEDRRNDGSRKKGGKRNAQGNPQGLPPGIEKKLERGGDLPPGIAKKDLVDDLDRRLPPVRQGYERAEIDGDVVLIEIATQTIADIIYGGAARPRR